MILTATIYFLSPEHRGASDFWDFIRTHSLSATESMYFAQALRAWQQVLAEGPAALLAQITTRALEFATIDSPVAVLAGVAALAYAWCFVAHARSLVVLVSVIALTALAGGVFWSPAVTARGYLLYGSMTFVYVLCAIGVDHWFRTRRTQLVRGLALTCLAAALAGHAGWNAAFYWGELRPVTLYMFGYRQAERMAKGPPTFVSLNSSASPAVLGGTSTYRAQAATFEGHSDSLPRNLFANETGSSSRSSSAPSPMLPAWQRVIVAVGARSYVAAVALAALWAARARFTYQLLLAALVLASSVTSAMVAPNALLPQFWHTAFGVEVTSTPATYRLIVDDAARHALLAATGSGGRLTIVSPGATNAEISTNWTGSEWHAAAVGAVVSPASLLATPSSEPLIVLARAADDTIGWLPCWQRANLEGREWTSEEGLHHCAPSIELRVLDAAGIPLAIAY